MSNIVDPSVILGRNNFMVCRVWLLILVAVVTRPCWADDAAAKQVSEVVAAVGGEAKLLSLFRFRERVLIVSEPAPPVKPDEKENRTSVVQVGKNWRLGTDKRDKDKVRVLCWAWSLRILLEPTSKIQPLPEITVDDKPAFGLRVSESVKEPIDLYFDKESKRLVAIDYTDTRHLFSEWKKIEGGGGISVARRRLPIRRSYGRKAATKAVVSN